MSEYQARTDPHDAASSPIAVVDSIPQPNAGITNNARVPADTFLTVLIASMHGVDVGDPESSRFTVEDGELDPDYRGLGSDTVRKIEVETGNGLNLIWVVYERSLETGLPMADPYDAQPTFGLLALLWIMGILGVLPTVSSVRSSRVLIFFISQMKTKNTIAFGESTYSFFQIPGIFSLPPLLIR